MTVKPPFGLVSLDEANAQTTDAHDHRKGHLDCPVCSLHDHRDDGTHPDWCERCALLGQAVLRD